MRQIIQELLYEDVKNCIKWRKRIKLLHIIAGNKISIERKEKHLWLESSPWRRHVILVLWHTLMPVKQRQQNVFYSIQDVFISQEKPMKVPHKLTGWSRSRIVELQSHLLLQQPNGKSTEST